MYLPLESKAYRTNIKANLDGMEFKLPVITYNNYNRENKFPLLYIPISYLPNLRIEVFKKDSKLFLRSNYTNSKGSKLKENQIEILKEQNKSLIESNEKLTKQVNDLNTIINKLKAEIDRLKSFPEDIPYETKYDHIFDSNPDFFIYYGKKEFTNAVEENEQLQILVDYMEANGLRVNWIYYPAANQIYLYISFLNQRLGLNNYDSDKIRNLIGKAYKELKNDFTIITKDQSIRLEISIVFLETIEGYEVQRSIFVNENNFNEYIKENTSMN